VPIQEYRIIVSIYYDANSWLRRLPEDGGACRFAEGVALLIEEGSD
jgi:hypothetical protein